jgi:hypothetical protein
MPSFMQWRKWSRIVVPDVSPFRTTLWKCGTITNSFTNWSVATVPDSGYGSHSVGKGIIKFYCRSDITGGWGSRPFWIKWRRQTSQSPKATWWDQSTTDWGCDQKMKQGSAWCRAAERCEKS